MFALLRKYPLAVFLSVLLHGGLAFALILKMNDPAPAPGIDLDDAAPIQAVAVSESDIQAEVERLQSIEDEKAKAAAEPVSYTHLTLPTNREV